MFGLFYVIVALVNDFEWWLRCRQLRAEAMECADRIAIVTDDIKCNLESLVT